MPIGDRTNLCYSSTVVTKGRGTGVVIGTGMNTQVRYKFLSVGALLIATQIGRIAEAMNKKPRTDTSSSNHPHASRVKNSVLEFL